MNSTPHAGADHRERWSRRARRLALVLVLVALSILISGGLRVAVGGFELSATNPLNPLGLAALSFALALGLARDRRAVLHRAWQRALDWWTATGRAPQRRNGIRMLRGCAVVLVCGAALWRVRGELLELRASELESRGHNYEAARLFAEASRYAFGQSAPRASRAANCFFRGGEYQRSVELVERAFRDTSTMPRRAHRAYMHSLYNLERFDDSIHAAKRAVSAFASLSREVDALISLARKRLNESDLPVTLTRVEVRLESSSSGPFELIGSWTERGAYSHTEGWTRPVAMRACDAGHMATLALQPSDELPFGCVARRLDESGAVLEAHAANFHVDPTKVADGGALSAVLKPFEDAPHPGSAALRRVGADGSRRVLAVWPDCGAWPILHVFAQAGRLPNIERLMRSSASWELISTHPPYTSTAYLAMTTMIQEQEDDEFGVVPALAMQLNGLPVLDQLLPDRFVPKGRVQRTFFDALTDAGVSWSNMVFNDKYLFAEEDGKSHSEDSGVHAASLSFSYGREGHDDRVEWYLENTAEKAELALAEWRGEAPSFLLVRFPAIDIASHRFYAEYEDDPGRGALRQVYEHLDQVLGELYAELDQDDVLMFISDHGMQSTLTHHPSCFCFVEDQRIPARGFQGTLPIRLFSSFVLSRYGVREGAERLSDELRRVLYAE